MLLSKCGSFKLILNIFRNQSEKRGFRRCHTVFNFNELIQQPKPKRYVISHVTNNELDLALKVIKDYYLREHVMVRSRNMNISDDRAIDDYYYSMMKQGNGIMAKTQNGELAGLCVGYASCSIDPDNLRNYAFYRQDPNTKDFLYFQAKLQETPNLWDVLKQKKIYEIKVLTVLPEFRRQGLAVRMLEESKQEARDQGYKFTRMDCINSYDYKIAERCMMQCIARFPLHKLRGPNTPFVKRSSEFNVWVRVYIDSPPDVDQPDKTVFRKVQNEIESVLQ